MAKDIVVLCGAEPQAIASIVASRFSLPTLVDGRDVLVETERGHEWVPRLVEGLAGHRLDSVSLRRPTLADVFLKITGTALAADLAGGAR